MSSVSVTRYTGASPNLSWTPIQAAHCLGRGGTTLYWSVADYGLVAVQFCALTPMIVRFAEDNPITAKIIETLLIRLGCRCVVVADGSEAISVAMGDIIDGDGAAKSTNSKNTNTYAVTWFPPKNAKMQFCSGGFKTSTMQGAGSTAPQSQSQNFS
ncbi:hypothetical protein K438DRAFT_1934179 [Mycena galopus ATCC 62051]|nr:hypothetical protein K438DRAFT_1934179 [Mycena galopus ATCC 62051]